MTNSNDSVVARSISTLFIGPDDASAMVHACRDPRAPDNRALTQERIVRTYARRIAAISAALGAVAALPGAGTAVVVSTTTADLLLAVKLIVDMVRCLAVLHGFDLNRPEVELELLRLAVDAAGGVRRHAREARVVAEQVAPHASTLVEPLLERLGAVALKRLSPTVIPMGIGAIAGGLSGYFWAKGIGERAAAALGALARDGQNRLEE